MIKEVNVGLSVNLVHVHAWLEALIVYYVMVYIYYVRFGKMILLATGMLHATRL